MRERSIDGDESGGSSRGDTMPKGQMAKRSSVKVKKMRVAAELVDINVV